MAKNNGGQNTNLPEYAAGDAVIDAAQREVEEYVAAVYDRYRDIIRRVDDSFRPYIKNASHGFDETTVDNILKNPTQIASFLIRDPKVQEYFSTHSMDRNPKAHPFQRLETTLQTGLDRGIQEANRAADVANSPGQGAVHKPPAIVEQERWLDHYNRQRENQSRDKQLARQMQDEEIARAQRVAADVEADREAALKLQQEELAASATPASQPFNAQAPESTANDEAIARALQEKWNDDESVPRNSAEKAPQLTQIQIDELLARQLEEEESNAIRDRIYARAFEKELNGSSAGVNSTHPLPPESSPVTAKSPNNRNP